MMGKKRVPRKWDDAVAVAELLQIAADYLYDDAYTEAALKLVNFAMSCVNQHKLCDGKMVLGAVLPPNEYRRALRVFTRWSRHYIDMSVEYVSIEAGYKRKGGRSDWRRVHVEPRPRYGTPAKEA